MSYEVFARKYRPQGFQEVLGQDAVVRTLCNAIKQERLAHAYLFVGPRGVGKTSTARIFAKALNCVNGPTENPCGKCDSCREITAGNSLDVLEIDGASNNGVEQVRELRENVRFMPTHGKFRIYLIDEVHMLSVAAFNALLKTLEEPPAHVKFLFATTEAHKLPATIISRCQRFDLQPIRIDVVAAHLQTIAQTEKVELDAAAAEVIARAGEGSMRDAESMLDQVVSFCGNKVTEKDVLAIFGVASAEDVAALLGNILTGDAAMALDFVAKQAEEGKDLGHLLSDLVVLSRDLLVSEVTRTVPSGRQGTLLTPLKGKFSARKLTDLLEVLSSAESGLRFSPDKKLPLEIAVIKSIQLLHTADLDEVLGALAELRGGGSLAAVEPRPSKSLASTTLAKPEPATKQPSASPKENVETSAPAPRFAILEKPVETGAKREMAKQVSAGDSKEQAAETAPNLAKAEVGKVWEHVVGEISSKQRIKSAWLDEMQSLEECDGVLRVVFPEKQSKLLHSPIVEEHGELIQQLWKKFTGRDIRFLPEATGKSVEVKEEEIKNTIEDFENDPAIEAALEIFEATIESEKK